MVPKQMLRVFHYQSRVQRLPHYQYLATGKVMQMEYFIRWGSKMSPTTMFNHTTTHQATCKAVQLGLYNRWGIKSYNKWVTK